jgi:hypothetical protein
MNDFRIKAQHLQELRRGLDDYVWEVFDKYIKAFHINFNHPETWWIDESEDITFDGSDGCMGCYDSMQLTIPIEFFEDFEGSAAKKLASDQAEKEIEEKKEKEANESRELATYQRLKEKYDKAQ